MHAPLIAVCSERVPAWSKEGSLVLLRASLKLRMKSKSRGCLRRILENCVVLKGVEVREKETSHAVLSHTHPQFIGEQSPMSLWGMPHVE